MANGGSDNPEMNVVVFEFENSNGLGRATMPGTTRDPHNVENAWHALARQADVAPERVRRVYSEWQPSPEDQAFLEGTFPNAACTFSFERPEDGDWDRAFERASPVLSAAVNGGEKIAASKPWWRFW